jgi:hypothetical protein
MFGEAHAREFAERTRRCRTLGANAAEDRVGVVQTALLHIGDGGIEQSVARRGRRWDGLKAVPYNVRL